MKQTKRKNITIFLGGIVVGSIIVGLSQTNEFKKPTVKDNVLAMYLENDDGGYDLSSEQIFPTEGYALNTEKSTCKNGGTLTQDSTTKKLSLSVSNSDQCNVYFDKEKTTSSGSTLIAKANDTSVASYTAGNQQEMFAFDHDITSTDTNSNSYTASQIENWTVEERRDYRYIGNNPNNYITFNEETWRIIGVFTVETEDGSKEQLMKIIRNESIGNLAWNSSQVNEWSTSSLKTLLNGDYYNQSGSYTSTGLSETAREQIANVKWYLGGSNASPDLGGPNYYSFERGTTVYESGRSTNIVAKVGLMYPSDYVYTYGKGVNETCYTNGYYCYNGTPSVGWLFNSAYQWTISPKSGRSSIVFRITSTGCVNNDITDGVNSTYGVRPSVYLKSNIQIKSGTGASNDPYTLE